MKTKILGLLAVGLLAGPMAAGASVVYDFTGNFGGTEWSFVYETSDFILTDQTVPAADLTSCTAPVGCINVGLSPSGLGSQTAADSINIFTIGGFQPFFIFQDGALGAFGSYDSANGTPTYNGTLVVRRGSTAVPEPGTLALLVLGLAGLGLSRRRTAA